MTEQAALLAAIRASPTDDTPRLVYADWCEDNGREERAELIRVQVRQVALEAERSRQPGEPFRAFMARCDAAGGRWNGEQAELRARFAALLPWLREMPNPLGLVLTWSATVDVEWVPANQITPCGRVQRGFLELIACPAEDWMRHADAVLAEDAVLRVTLTTHPWDEFEEPHNRTGRRRLVGRKRYWDDAEDLKLHEYNRDASQADPRAWSKFLAAKLFAAEWPGVEFTIPEPIDRPAVNNAEWNRTLGRIIESAVLDT